MTNRDAENRDKGGTTRGGFDELVERSSLGTPGAKALRKRTSVEHAHLARDLARLRNKLVHGPLEDATALGDLVALANQCDQMGLHDEALRGYLQAAEHLIGKIALNFEQRGNTEQASVWRARATTFDQ